MGLSLDNIRKDIRMHKETDKQMSRLWLLIYIIPIVVATIYAGYMFVEVMNYIASMDYIDGQYPAFGYGSDLPFVPNIPGVMAMGLTSALLNVVLIYMLVNRRRTHFKRQKFLYEDLVSAIKSLATNKDVEIESNLSHVERTVREAESEESSKDAVLWAFLAVFVPFAVFYVYYFLMKDFYSHEQRENWFWRDISTTLNKLEVKFSVPRRTEEVPDRSFVLYLILTIITLGLFGIYWLYVLIKDPNEHFKYHIETEKQLLIALETVTN